MCPEKNEIELYGRCTDVVSRSAERCVYRLGSADGEALLTVYPVFPGIEIGYYDVHASLRVADGAQRSGLIEICHCREGRIEYQSGDEFFFLSPGDLSVSVHDAARGDESFPTGHYHGISVMIDPERAPDCLSCMLEDVNVRPRAIAEKFCADSSFFAARASSSVRHIFSELYSVPEDIRKGYFKVKILELLLFLSALPVQKPAQTGYSRTQTALAHSICACLQESTEKKITVQELSQRLGASPSLINNCFRGVYGVSPAAYLRAQKMHGAARLLRETDRTVLDIAGQFGYDNASKFAKAFRGVIGVSPAEYRSGADTDSCAPA